LLDGGEVLTLRVNDDRREPVEDPPVMLSAASVRPMALLVLLSLASPARADELASKFEQYMDACVAQEGFSGSVLVTKDGKDLFRKGYGLANAEHRIPNAPETKFRLGSITKQFTAMAILILQERGKLKVDDTIGKHLDDAPKAWEGVTIHHLLTHTSGIHSYTSDPEYMKKMAYHETVKSMIARFKDKPLDFKPGEKFEYSNSGYFLLGAIIEKTSGETYEKFLKHAIFEPLGMKDTGYDHFATVIPRRASGYSRKSDGLENSEYLDMAQPYAAGSLYSTVDDLARWDRALNEGKLISKASYEKMYTPAKNDYAYGWVVKTRSGRKEIGHGGGINGFATQISRYPDRKACVVVLCNVLPSNPGRVAQDLAAIAFGEPYKIPKERKVARVDPSLYDAYVGRYRIAPEMTLTVTREGDRLMLEPTGQPKLEVFPESETEFFLKVVDAQITFVRDGKGKVTEAVLHQGGRDMKAKRLEPDGAKTKD
jgi:CubicO group peptidase (beta-lactamase class C family)